nr:hypothetical protein [uncultured Deefgea sp.]
MNQPQKLFAPEFKGNKKQIAKKSFAERFAGQAPFAWLKLDATIAIAK